MTRLAIVASVVLAACTGTETGNPLTSETSVVVRTTDEAVAALRVPAGGPVVTEAWISLDRIAITRCGAGDVVAFQGPSPVEILDGGGRLEVFAAESGDYCGVTAGLVPLPAATDGAPPELAGATLLVTGRRTDGTPFTIRSSHGTAITLDASPSPVMVDADGIGLLVAFDAATWLGSIDLTAATVGADGTIAIDDAENTALLSAFEAMLPPSASAHRDLDRDGMLDATEGPIAHHL